MKGRKPGASAELGEVCGIGVNWLGMNELAGDRLGFFR